MVEKLAIVIPAFKTRYLEEALSSISAQTNKNFKVYVCDDGSSEDIKAITEKFSDSLNLTYKRFPDNAGRYDLIKHWNRSVDVAEEEWVWLFSDDDVMSPGCVAAAIRTLNDTYGRHNVYRFNIEMINAEGEVICVKRPHPILESAFEFLIGRLQSQTLSAAAEYIFNKNVFKYHKGFVNFPLAFCSDDASWITFAGDLPIYTIAGQKVFWRQSGINISSLRGLQDSKANALISFLNFIVKKFPEQKALLITYSRTWFIESIRHLPGRLSISKFLQIWISSTRQFGWLTFDTFKKLLASQLKNTRFGEKSRKWSEY